jgi:hypothetical protein
VAARTLSWYVRVSPACQCSLLVSPYLPLHHLAVETAELERLEAAATKARDAWSAKSDRLAEAQREARELEEQLQRDYGPDDAFLALEVRFLLAAAAAAASAACSMA